ncbi:YuzF family protein [Lysinibacillus sp. MHQ-1]|nr:YuzF family protein [Lysinibacillus sp. MHQ-1]
MAQTGSISNPYLYETLKMMIGQAIVVQTEKKYSNRYFIIHIT